MKRNLSKKICTTLVVSIISFASISCDQAQQAISSAAATQNSGRYLYIATGTCYSGTGNTTFTTSTASNLVYRIDLGSGIKDTIADFNSFPATAGDSPVGVLDWDNNNIMVLVETTSGRRIEIVEKKAAAARSIFTANSTALSAVLRDLVKTIDGGVLVSKSSAIEKFSNLALRQVIGAATPWISAPGGSCGTSATLMSSLAVLNNGNIVFAHANAAQNKVGIISGSGYSSAANCLAAQTAPNANSFPTAIDYDSVDNQLFVAYAGNSTATDLNSIYEYDINESTNTIGTATKLIDANTSTFIYGISSIAYDSVNKNLYVATSNGTSTTVSNYNIEKFSYDPTTKTLTRAGVIPYYPYGYDTKCIASMIIGN
jgi:hypothetical protein